MHWEFSALTNRPLLHKRGFHKGASAIAHIRGLYVMWYLINSWRLLSENPQPSPPTPHPRFHSLKKTTLLLKIQKVQVFLPFGQHYKFFSPPLPWRKGRRTLRTGFSFTCGIVFHYRFRYDVLSEENISTLWSFGGMYILPSPVFFTGENPPSRSVGNLGWWESDKQWFWPFESSWKLETIFCK